MKQHRKLARVVAGAAVAALVLTGCRGGGDEDSASGPGITEEACPDAVNEDNGCIYLGAISDLTKGPFAPLAVSPRARASLVNEKSSRIGSKAFRYVTGFERGVRPIGV